MMRKSLALLFSATIGYASLGATTAAAETFVTIGTGGQTGVYYVVGQSVCRLLNRNSAEHGIRCNAPSSGGSVANVNAIRGGEMNMGVVQSDIQYKSYEGIQSFESEGPFSDMRALFALHGEPLTIVARNDANIAGVKDLKGKRVNIGNPGSGQRDTMDVVMQALGWTVDDFALASALDAAEQAAALGDNNIDAMVYVVGHPNGSIQEATTTVDANLVSVSGPEIDQLISDRPYYAKAIIPGGLYRGNDADTETFGVRATLVASTATDDETVYQTVKAVFENFDRFKRLHPAFATLKEEEMIKDGLSAPLHEGAIRYYKERGWM
ncbi:TAXI family TRAP transporter solute-binding subunit [Halopseudomonas aestusnigri]|jgi:TRAP transporter TAXI family solute receptor|uniref:TAXI family TRAP transporter solute-binding subunit n=1 Tax=Halopseudomonas TaxID=2901189 RepID=UPI000C8CC528|nr:MULTISPECIES: TAXI family TRAP transporter solute-binding subunit [Halopseudomonas]MAH00005.1 C4-dicarboxylate ABC transporter substrate-binding protein [Pseudomonadales bacterium]HBT56287.1 C4-dicarboxylate ABC transporter substrate-binding protein [Pseudomonas sp.]MAP76398.1 C4-dicarboxylate ABC transporter substrate-binding protein [Pseudomonadales bacterium]MCK5530679.1 TAXI family TRAP transporter solute-binding subunit [Halopseudomonas aestusnigri]UGV32220.1 TAXI family TRAP transport|tara:strand:+ start:10118 stop:11089 length:972 start_codon:yes stop_codon:yes gene_type:complete